MCHWIALKTGLASFSWEFFNYSHILPHIIRPRGIEIHFSLKKKIKSMNQRQKPFCLAQRRMMLAFSLETCLMRFSVYTLWESIVASRISPHWTMDENKKAWSNMSYFKRWPICVYKAFTIQWTATKIDGRFESILFQSAHNYKS